MCGESGLRSLRDMNILLLLLMISGPLITAVVTAPLAKKTNERYRERRAAKLAEAQA